MEKVEGCGGVDLDTVGVSVERGEKEILRLPSERDCATYEYNLVPESIGPNRATPVYDLVKGDSRDGVRGAVEVEKISRTRTIPLSRRPTQCRLGERWSRRVRPSGERIEPPGDSVVDGKADI